MRCRKRVIFGWELQWVIEVNPSKYLEKLNAMSYPLAVTSSSKKMKLIMLNYASCSMLYQIQNPETTA